MTNLGGLLLARNESRRSEFLMRRALGASRRRLLGHVTLQSAILAAAGLLVGVGFGSALVETARRQLPWDFPRLAELSLDGVALAAATGAAMLVAIGSGLVSLPHGVAETGWDLRGMRRRGGRALDRILAVQIAVTVVLLVAGGLVLRSFFGLAFTDPGISAQGVIALDLRLPHSIAGDDSQIRQFVSEVDQAVSRIPGVESAGQIQRLPFAGGNWSSNLFEPGTPREGHRESDVRVITPGYLRTIGLRVLSGRNITEEDDSRAPRAVLVNGRLAQRMWPFEDPIGKRLVVDMFGDWEGSVVGVVGEVRHHGLSAQVQPELYIPYEQAPVVFSTLVVRSSATPEVVSEIRHAIRGIRSTVTISSAALLADLVKGSISTPRLHAFVFGSIALLALTLGGIGTFSVASFRVARQRRDIGLRAALGASPGLLRRAVLVRTTRILLAGSLLGLLASLILLRGLSNILHDLTYLDPATYAATLLTIGLLGLAATLHPAWKASQVDPVAALRDQ